MLHNAVCVIVCVTGAQKGTGLWQLAMRAIKPHMQRTPHGSCNPPPFCNAPCKAEHYTV
jgi:hypothetical protein